MVKRGKRADYRRPDTAGSAARELAPQQPPMPKRPRRTWWPIAGAALVLLLGVGAAVGTAIARGGDPPIPPPGSSVTPSP